MNDWMKAHNSPIQALNQKGRPSYNLCCVYAMWIRFLHILANNPAFLLRIVRHFTKISKWNSNIESCSLCCFALLCWMVTRLPFLWEILLLNVSHMSVARMTDWNDPPLGMGIFVRDSYILGLGDLFSLSWIIFFWHFRVTLWISRNQFILYYEFYEGRLLI